MKSISHFFLLALVAAFTFACSSAPEGEKAKTGEAEQIDNKAAAGAKEVSVDVSASLINWVGTKVGGEHSGDMRIKSGSLKVDGGKIVGGSFVLDMASINVTDLEGESKGKLEGHLKTGDFFEVEKFPEGKFEIASVEEKAGEKTTHIVKGNLTLKDKTVSIEIPASVKIDAATGAVEANAPQFLVDRQQFGISYKGMKDAPINDNMGIAIKLVAK